MYPPLGEAAGWLIIVVSMLCVQLLVIKTIVDIYWLENDRGNISDQYQHVGKRPYIKNNYIKLSKLPYVTHNSKITLWVKGR